MASRRPLSRAQKVVLATAFVPMLATGVAGGVGTFTNISRAYGKGTALGAVAAGEGATAVLALVLLGLTMLGQASPLVVRAGLWALPAAASAMAAMAADDPGRTVIYAVTPMGMCVSAEGMAFLARRIVVHTDGRDAEAERKAAAVVQALAYHRARAANHPDAKVQQKSERTSWKLARKVGAGDTALGARLLDIQRDRVTDGANAALADMFSMTHDVPPAVTRGADRPELESAPTPSTNQDETTETIGKRSTAELEESTPATLAPIEAEPTPTAPAPAPVVELIDRPVTVVAAAKPRPRRATGRVPASARSSRPKRTPAQLLDEARSATADWPIEDLTAEAIRKAVRTAPAKARELRDTLQAERAEDSSAEAA
ncbi:conjugal transfer protein [Streptomyces platensis]|uniref:conjugal transfer protein n=1 Tax=Streptomyces platensis TaxID=58346 RepID=UPI002E0DB6EA|nr:conjugal transfer protein [Streptomyces platensis]